MGSVWFVPEGLDGDRVDAAAARMTGLSRSRIEDLAETGGVLVNSVPVAKSFRVSSGDLLEVAIITAPTVSVTPAMVAGMAIVYDDADIVVVDKPAGVAAHPSLGWDGPSVVEHLAAAGFRISTSGAPERQGIVQHPEDKNAALLPERIGGDWVLLHRPTTGFGAVWHGEIVLSRSPDLASWSFALAGSLGGCSRVSWCL